MWNPAVLLFVTAAVVVATGPVIYAVAHSARFGHHASPFERGHARTPGRYGWTTCPTCTAVVTDLAAHAAIHPVDAAAPAAPTVAAASAGEVIVEAAGAPGPRAVLAGRRTTSVGQSV